MSRTNTACYFRALFTMTEPQTSWSSLQTQLMLPSADPLTRAAFTSFNQLYLTLICYAFLLPDLKATKKNRLQAVKGEILDVIKQITGSRYSWIGIYHIAFGDSEVQSSNSSGNSCYFNLVQIRLRLKLYEKKKAVHSFILPLLFMGWVWVVGSSFLLLFTGTPHSSWL